MVILGIDPGTATTGYGVIKKLPGGKFELLDFGVIKTDKHFSDAERLQTLADDLIELIRKYKPAVAGVEKLFFQSNQKTVMSVSQSRGVILLQLINQKIPIKEFTPLQVKSTICGNGQADKQQIQFMIKQTFKLARVPKPDDAADAVAIALCAAVQVRS